MRNRIRLPSTLPTPPALAALALAMLPVGALAQTEEVIVTTGFRPTSLANSVGSASIIDAGVIEVRGAEHLEAVLGTAPNVTLSSGASRARFVQIRGIGDLEQFVAPKHYPSIGLSIDGIDLGGIASAAMLFDVGQVEILRGPQGTRFGASALAGQVAMSSVAPSESFDAYIDAGVGDYGQAVLGLAAGGALGENLAGRIALRQHSGDGYLENATLGTDDANAYDESTLRGRLRFTPTDAATLDVTAIRYESRNGYDAFSLDHTRTTLSDQPGNDDLELSALGLRGRLELGSASAVEANLTWLDSMVDYGYDEDWSFVGLCDGTLCAPADEFSNTDRYRRARADVALDLRWLGENRGGAGRERQYVVGVYAQDREETLARDYYGPFTSEYAAYRVALYGQVEAGLAERFRLTAGYRYERFDDRYADSFAAASASDDEFHSGELALRYALGDASSIYGLIARSNKPGGVNTEVGSVVGLLEPRFQDFVAPRLRFGSEALTNLEVGYQTALNNSRLDLRAALFRMTRDDAQLESWILQYVPFLWVGLLDTADGTNLGLEFEIDFAASERWRLRGSLGLLETEVATLTSLDIDLDAFVRRDGIEQAKSPSWQLWLASIWTMGSHWQLALDVDARDAERYGYYHDGRIPRATIVSGSLRRRIGQAELTLWARNLLDEDYAVHGLYFGNDPRDGYLPERYLQLGEPRIVGLSLRYAF